MQRWRCANHYKSDLQIYFSWDFPLHCHWQHYLPGSSLTWSSVLWASDIDVDGELGLDGNMTRSIMDQFGESQPREPNPDYSEGWHYQNICHLNQGLGPTLGRSWILLKLGFIPLLWEKTKLPSLEIVFDTTKFNNNNSWLCHLSPIIYLQLPVNLLHLSQWVVRFCNHL